MQGGVDVPAGLRSLATDTLSVIGPRAELADHEQRQTTRLAAAGAAEPPDLHSVDLARSSIRLFEVTHELDEASRANIKGCALSAIGE